MDSHWRLFGIVLVLLLAGCPGDRATWRYEPAPPADDDVGDDDDDDDDDLIYEKLLWGFQEDEEAWTGFYFSDPDQGGELCDVEYEVASWEVTDDCVECVLAWTITRGGQEVLIDQGGACEDEGWLGLEGTSFGVGHDGDELWSDLGEGWEVVDEAYFEQEEDWTFFEIFFVE